jgi:hypothetical protein
MYVNIIFLKYATDKEKKKEKERERRKEKTSKIRIV